MFGPPWGPPSPFELHAYLARRSKPRHSRPEPQHYSPFSHSHPLPPQPWHTNKPHGSKPHPTNLSKQTRFSNLDTPPGSDLSSSDRDDTYTLDTDSDLDRLPSLPLHRAYSDRAPHTPALDRVSVTLPHATASMLRRNHVLFLPPLVHLRIRICFPGGGRDELRAAVPGAMVLSEVTRQVVRCYVGTGMGYAARVEQRGRMQEVPRDAVVEDLAHMGEVYSEGRMEMKVEIVVVGGGSGGGVRERLGGRGPRRGAQVETVRKREVSRTRYAHA